MLLDIRTVFGIAFAHNLTFGLIFLFIQGDYSGPMQRSMKTWGWAHIIGASGWALSAARGSLPELPAILLGNVCFLYAQSELIQALRFFDERPPARKWALALGAAGMLPASYFYLFNNILANRVAAVSLAIAALHAMAALHTKTLHAGRHSKSRLITSLGFWGLASIFALRALYTLGPGASINSLLENSSVQSLVYGASIFGLLLISYGFLLMCNEKFNSELKRLAASDSLTGLYNRRAMDEMAHREISRAQRARTPLLYMMMDLDLFKRINDSLGHAVGDIALQQVAATLRNNVRSQDIVGRLGGDEFAVLLPDTDRCTGEAIARRLSSIIQAAPFRYNGHSIELGMSIGISELRLEHGELESLMRRADDALYQEKRKKRDTAT